MTLASPFSLALVTYFGVTLAYSVAGGTKAWIASGWKNS